VAFAMAERAKPAKITLLGRGAERLSALARDLREGTNTPIEAGALSGGVEKAVQEHDVIVQGTPVGMHGHDEGRSCIPAEALRADQVVFDMVYRPLKTRLIQDAEAAGCATIWGAEMLANQAALQFEAWMEMDAPRQVMRAALLAALGGPA